ncbi:MAG: flippase-like domain-containing protein [Alphaproteobacteria bacterium]|nr:flippase-like domain-containing protein [Alphaproteobacteria bacterium]MBV9694306.1 flippase-like domain-containing protein [Alphaproteobacteria bacterium]
MEAVRTQPRRRGGMKALALLAFAAGTALLAWLVVGAGWVPVKDALAAIGLGGLLLVALAHLPVIAVLGAAWRLGARIAPRPNAAHFAWARALRDAGSEVLPFSQLGGVALGARALALLGVGRRNALAWTFLDLLIEFAAKIPYVLAGLALLAFLHRRDVLAVIALAAAIVTAAALLILRPAFRVAWRQPKLLRRGLLALRRVAPRPGDSRAAFLLHLLGWFLGAGETWLIFRLMQKAVGFAPALVIDSVVGAIRALGFFVPGAVGVQEGAYVALCGLFAISPATALAFSLIRRARDLLIAAAVLLPWPWRELQRLARRNAAFKS